MTRTLRIVKQGWLAAGRVGGLGGDGWKRLRGGVSGETPLAAVLFIALWFVPYVVTGYPVFILPQYMLFGVLALSLSLLWGYVGIVSFGQAAFFSLGAYSFGLILGKLPATSAPYVGLAVAAAAGAALSGVIGYFLFTGGVRDSYFVLVTLAISTIAQVVANTESGITGGFNGLYVQRALLELPGSARLSLQGDLAAYYVILLFTVAAYMGLRFLLATKFGKVLVGIRVNEDRTVALGYNTALYKTVAFALSGSIAGVAGALYATDAGFVSPDLGGVLFSTNVVVWVAIGGRQHLVGALIGAIGISALSNYLNGMIPRYWQLALGVLFVAVITFFRHGLVGGALHGAGLVRRRHDA